MPDTRQRQITQESVSPLSSRLSADMTEAYLLTATKHGELCLRLQYRYQRMSKLIHTISQKVAKRIVSHSTQVVSANVVAYGLEVALGEFIKFSIFFFIGWLFDCMPQMMTLVLSYAIMRTATGGPHCTSYVRCLVLGVVSFTPLAILACYADGTILSGSILISVVFTTYATFRWVPGEWHQRRLKKSKEKYRNITTILLMIAYVLTMVLFLTNQAFWISVGQAIQLGIIWQFIGVTPLGYKLVHQADQFMIQIFQLFSRKEEIL